jgi:hypothetical protein
MARAYTCLRPRLSYAGGAAIGKILVHPNGPGVGPNLSTVTDHITLVATQPC